MISFTAVSNFSCMPFGFFFPFNMADIYPLQIPSSLARSSYVIFSLCILPIKFPVHFSGNFSHLLLSNFTYCRCLIYVLLCEKYFGKRCFDVLFCQLFQPRFYYTSNYANCQPQIFNFFNFDALHNFLGELLCFTTDL